MIIERKKNTIRSTIWGVINRTIAIVGPFIIRTLIIYTLGTEYLGLSSLFTSILQVLSMTELGLESAIAYSLYSPIARDDNEKICQIINYFRKCYKCIGVLVWGIGFLLMIFLQYLIAGEVPEDVNMYVLFFMYLFNSGIGYFLFAYKNVVFAAHQREDILSKVRSSLLIVEYIIQILILYFTRNYYLYYIIVPIISILNNVVVNSLSTRYYPQIIPNGEIDIITKKDIKKKLFGIVIGRFCGISRNSFDSIVLSMYLGLTTVAIYNNYYYILSNIASVMVIIVTSMRAGIGNSLIKESIEKNYNDYRFFSFMYAWIAALASISLLCIYQPFMYIWMGSDKMLDDKCIFLLGLYFWGLSLGDITNAYSSGAGLWWENRFRTITEAVSNVILNFLLGYFWGITGVLLATIITTFLFNFFWQTKILYNKCFTVFSFWEHFYDCLKYSLNTLLVSIITYYISDMIEINTWLKLPYVIIISFFVPNILFYIIYKNNVFFKRSINYLVFTYRKRV